MAITYKALRLQNSHDLKAHKNHPQQPGLLHFIPLHQGVTAPELFAQKYVWAVEMYGGKEEPHSCGWRPLLIPHENELQTDLLEPRLFYWGETVLLFSPVQKACIRTNLLFIFPTCPVFSRLKTRSHAYVWGNQELSPPSSFLSTTPWIIACSLFKMHYQ